MFNFPSNPIMSIVGNHINHMIGSTPVVYSNGNSNTMIELTDEKIVELVKQISAY
jgi:hypothetical protein